MTTGMALRMCVELLTRAGWAPLSVFLLHVFISRVLKLGLDDTLLDMALGIAGGASWVLMGWRQGQLGVVTPLRTSSTIR